jgi:hypothetical protein
MNANRCPKIRSRNTFVREDVVGVAVAVAVGVEGATEKAPPAILTVTMILVETALATADQGAQQPAGPD